MIKNSAQSPAKYLAVQHLDNPSRDDVPQVRAALEQASPKPTGRALHVKPGKNGLDFLSPNLADRDQPLSSVAASVAGKDETPALTFLYTMCAQIYVDDTNTPAVQSAANELFLHIVQALPVHRPHDLVNDTKAFRQKLNALDDAITFQKQDEPRQRAASRDKHKTKPGVNVEDALGARTMSPFVLTLARNTERELVEKVRQGAPLSDDDVERLEVARQVLANSTPQHDAHWDPMTEIRLETDLPPGYRPPGKQ